MEGYAQVAQPLHQLTKKGVPFGRTLEREVVFQTLKEALTKPVSLPYPDAKGRFYYLDMDASRMKIGPSIWKLLSKHSGEELLYNCSPYIFVCVTI